MSGFDDAKQAFDEYKKVVNEYKNNSDESIENLNSQVNNLQENVYKMYNRHQITSTSNHEAIEQKHSDKFFSIKIYKGEFNNQLEIYSKYCKAFNNYLRYSSDKHGEGLHEIEKKSLGIGTATDGGYYLPIGMFESILDHVKEISHLRKISSVIQIGSDCLKLPNSNINIPANWINSISSAACNCASGNCINCCANSKPIEKEISLFEHFTNPKVSQIHLDDNQFPIQECLTGKIASSFAASENSSFISENGTYQTKGFLSYESEVKGDSDSRAANKLECICCCCETGTDKYGLKAEKMIKTVFALNSTYRNGAVWLMNRATLEAVRKLKDENDTPIWNFENNSTPTVLGYPVYEMEGMPDLGEKCDGTCCTSGTCCCKTGTCTAGCTCVTPIAFGNFHAGYQIIDQGIKILRDPYSCKPWVMFYATKRVGGDVFNTNAIKLIKCCRKNS